MNTFQLDQKLSDVSGFIGAYPYDGLPNKPPGDFSIIINTDSKSGAGDHWLALVRKESVFYFHDSYGRHLDDELFTVTFKNTMRNYIDERCIFNSKWIQQIISNVCGFHSLYFISEMENKDFRVVLSVFTDNLKKNDDFVVKYANSL